MFLEKFPYRVKFYTKGPGLFYFLCPVNPAALYILSLIPAAGSYIIKEIKL